MKKVSRRAIAALVLAGILLAGVLVFAVRYFTQGARWATFAGNPHTAGVGTVTDRSGTVLLSGGQYTEDELLRRATVHLLGDPGGNVPATVTTAYAPELAGYNAWNGLRGAESRRTKLELTVDAEVQKTALQALNGKTGTVLVYNYATGELLCAVSSTTFDPAAPLPEAPEDGLYINRAFRAAYTPGSIFKLVTAATALEVLPDAETETFTCEGTFQIGKDTITCTGVHGEVDLREALAKSCNCAFAQLALKLGREALTERVERWQITKPCEFDGITTETGHFDLTDTADSELAWAGIGQYTDLVNPCAYLQFVGTIAGGGGAAKPYLVRTAGDYQAKTTRVTTMTADAAERLAEDMAYNVISVYGVGSFPPVTVCAKSGTAEVGPDQTPHATFTGFIRDQEYPLAFFIAVEHGGSGSAVGTPIAGTVLRACVAAMDAQKK